MVATKGGISVDNFVNLQFRSTQPSTLSGMYSKRISVFGLKKRR